MSGRMATQLLEDVPEAGSPKAMDAESTMGSFVNAILKLETAGEVTLIVEEEGDE
ncbi:hypothetical protein N9F04_03070 [Ascidiaceihabitans sp.]|nr:hypothetical protein [Ascidiaceihabitans sp.]